jgi:DNA-directed RNA polymerase subunit H (RpoH/RPB5)
LVPPRRSASAAALEPSAAAARAASDPCARYLGARRGTVLCITRRPASANELVTYRVVT